MRSFSDLCLQAYLSEETSLYDFISVNAGLYSLFRDYACTAQLSHDEKQRNMQYASVCRDNLETAMTNIPIQPPASADVIAALLFAAGSTSPVGNQRQVAKICLGILFDRILDPFALLVVVIKGS